MQVISLTIWSNYFEVASEALRSGHLFTAETMFAAALAEAENYDLCALQQAASLHGLACAYRKTGRKGASEMLLRKAFRIICDADQINVEDLARVACLLADSYLESGEAAKALPVLKLASDQVGRRAGSESPTLVPMLKRMALIYMTGKRRGKADAFLGRAMKIEAGCLEIKALPLASAS